MDTTPTTEHHPVATRAQWLEARLRLLAREKAFTHEQDRLAEARRALPWVRIEKDYVFDTAAGPRRLADLFGRQRQLLVQHFMFGPDWDEGCPSCSYMADHTDAMRPHLAARGIAMSAVSRAPLARLLAFRERMGWTFDWVSSLHSDFNIDFGVSFTPAQREHGMVEYNHQRQPFPHEEAPGISAFWRDADGTVFHTYSTYGRGVEAMMGSYRLIDLAPLGRDEDALPHPMAWVKHHDRYADAPRPPGGCCHG